MIQEPYIYLLQIKLLDTASKSTTDVIKTDLKRAIQ